MLKWPKVLTTVFAPNKEDHIRLLGTMVEPPPSPKIYTWWQMTKSLPWNLVLTPMSHDVRCIGLLLQQPEEALSKSIAKSEPNSGSSWPDWWSREEMSHSKEVAGNRTTTQDLEIRDPSSEPGNESISCCKRQIDTISNRWIKQKCFQTWDWGGKGEMMCR